MLVLSFDKKRDNFLCIMKRREEKESDTRKRTQEQRA